MRSSPALAKNVSRDQIWPELANHFDKLSDADQYVLFKYISKYPKILEHIKPEQLAILSQFNILHILSYLANNDINQLENVISALIARPYFGEVISFWLKETTKLADEDSSGEKELNSLFKVMQQKNPGVEKYRELATSLKSLRRRKVTKHVVHEHENYLVNATNWNDTNSIEITIGKLKALEESVSIEHEIIDRILEKLRAIGDTEIISGVLSDASQAWLKKHLKN